MSDTLAREIANLKQRLAELETRPRIGSQRGTFTPTFAGTTIAGTFTYAVQRGVYRRYGDLVFVMAQCVITAITVAPTGNMVIADLPFVAGDGGVAGTLFAMTLGVVSAVDYPASAVELTAFIQNGQDEAQLFYTRDNAGTVAYPAASFTNANANIMLSGWYPL